MIIYYIIYYHMLYIKSTVVLLCFYILNTLRFNTSCFLPGCIMESNLRSHQALNCKDLSSARQLSMLKGSDRFDLRGLNIWKCMKVLLLLFFLNAFWTWTPAWSQEHVCALIFFVCFFGGMVMTIVENRMMDIMLWFMICDILLLLAVSSQIACQYSTAHASGPIYGTGSCHESCTRRWDIREMWRWVT